MSSTPAEDADSDAGEDDEVTTDVGDAADRDADSTGPTDQSTDATRSRPGSSGLGRWRSRDVEVPMRVYKTVTVFATLIAVVSVLGGFVLIDLATGRAQRPLSDVDAVVAILGIGAIAFGAVVYAFSTRFRATGMGKHNTGGGEGDDNG